MRYPIFITLFLCLSVHSQTLLLDDFDSGTGKNALGLDWFYFSDVNDTGTSIIHQTTKNTDGSYSRLVTNEHGKPGNLCAVLDFTLGDSLPCSTRGRGRNCGEFDAFVGMGTDLTPDGEMSIDLSSVISISFQARCTDPDMILFFEVITPEIANRNYFANSFQLFPTWKTVVISFDDLHQENWSDYDHMDLEMCLKKATKLTWQVRAADCKNLQSAVFEIDSIVLDGIDHLPEKTTNVHKPLHLTGKSHRSFQSEEMTGYFDLRGRVLQNITNYKSTGIACKRLSTRHTTNGNTPAPVKIILH